jgi:hypothetical protein
MFLPADFDHSVFNPMLHPLIGTNSLNDPAVPEGALQDVPDDLANDVDHNHVSDQLNGGNFDAADNSNSARLGPEIEELLPPALGWSDCI